ncbi:MULTISPECIES: hypothetical protein [unclassified Campylobacter]|uniref:hypothetical protein n=1 Tax=unclassified Campylobacter TaxID=2593542 RepID=UPI003D349A89
MRVFVLFFVLFNALFALSISDVKMLFDEQKFEQVCSKSVENLCLKANDEALFSLYATACIKIHKINSLFLPITKLRQSPQSRENAAYFADILLKKKLLYHALIDNIDISYIRLSKSDYILSMIFDRFVKNDFKKEDDRYIFREKNSDIFYELYADNSTKIPKIILTIHKNNKILEKIEYF